MNCKKRRSYDNETAARSGARALKKHGAVRGHLSFFLCLGCNRWHFEETVRRNNGPTK